MKFKLFYDDSFLKHIPPDLHPEVPERASGVLKGIQKALKFAKPQFAKEEHEIVSPPLAGKDFLSQIHPYAEDVIEILRRSTENGTSGFLEPDTYYSPGTYEASLRAAGVYLPVLEAFQEEEFFNFFAVVRPPGHHAHLSPSGFCIFNNIAITAKALSGAGLKVFIFDFDLHHGNGTQFIFYEDPSVFYFSIHRYPYYPGTGSREETGKGKGLGFTKNVPVSYNEAPGRVISALDEFIASVQGFSPHVLLVSAGFDMYIKDPLGGLLMEEEHFELVGRAIKEASAIAGGVPVGYFLEGGYAIEALPSLAFHLMRGFFS